MDTRDKRQEESWKREEHVCQTLDEQIGQPALKA